MSLKLFVCLFVCLFVVPLQNFSLIWRRHHYRWRAANFELCSAIMVFKQWRFFSVTHLLWQGPGHPFIMASPTRDTQNTCRAFGSGALTTCFNDLGLSRNGFEHPNFRLRGERSCALCCRPFPRGDNYDIIKYINKIFKSYNPEPLGQFQLNLARSILGWRDISLFKWRTIKYSKSR